MLGALEALVDNLSLELGQFRIQLLLKEEQVFLELQRVLSLEQVVVEIEPD